MERETLLNPSAEAVQVSSSMAERNRGGIYSTTNFDAFQAKSPPASRTVSSGDLSQFGESNTRQNSQEEIVRSGKKDNGRHTVTLRKVIAYVGIAVAVVVAIGLAVLIPLLLFYGKKINRE